MSNSIETISNINTLSQADKQYLDIVKSGNLLENSYLVTPDSNQYSSQGLEKKSSNSKKVAKALKFVDGLYESGLLSKQEMADIYVNLDKELSMSRLSPTQKIKFDLKELRQHQPIDNN